MLVLSVCRSEIGRKCLPSRVPSTSNGQPPDPNVCRGDHRHEAERLLEQTCDRLASAHSTRSHARLANSEVALLFNKHKPLRPHHRDWASGAHDASLVQRPDCAGGSGPPSRSRGGHANQRGRCRFTHDPRGSDSARCPDCSSHAGTVAGAAVLVSSFGDLPNYRRRGCTRQPQSCGHL